MFSSALFVLFVVSATAISQIPLLLYALRVSDLFAEAAIACFAFFIVLLCASFFSSHLVALYAKWVGICDNLNHSARLG